MVIKTRTYLTIFMCFCTFLIFGQKHLRTEVSFNKGSVYVGEPIEVSVSVYSTTWFTDGVDPGNIKIDGAYTIYFRSLSTSKKIDGKQYSGVTLFYNVFPYSDENVTFPSLTFSVETPDEGDYVGKKRSVKTRSRIIKVKPIPPTNNKNNWLVSNAVRVYDNWKGDLSKVKVGDVLERNITLKVSNTISELIPPVTWDTIQNISLYPKKSIFKNNKTKTSIGATRIDGTRYLFEKEGEYTIPEITIHWWNPRYNKLYKRVLKSKTIHVLPNPNLEILESIKKTLESSIEKEAAPKQALTVFGMPLKKFIIAFLLCIIVLYILIRLSHILYIIIIKRRRKYHQSEAYYFKLFLKSIKQERKKSEIYLYNWIDQLNLEEPTIKYFIKNYGTEYLLNSDQNSNTRLDRSRYRKEWKISRINYLQNKNRKVQTRELWVNP